jgi:hypothetical protein
MEIFGFSITFLSLVLAFLTWKNGKWMKETLNKQTEMISKQTEMIEKQTEAINSLGNLIVEEARLTRESTQNLIKYLADLIVSESQKTRELISKNA